MPSRAFDTGSGCREWSSVERPLGELAKKLSGEDRRGLTALFRSDINPYGTFRLDLDKRLDLLPALAPGSRRAADDGVQAAGSVSGG
ncbi:hypothetical protein ACFQ7Z_26820 [Streptomyces virginiae]|uniref:hypothetical protein n=1 Tax=Streptomyces virginiae TaxID=1961 RepID=UPI00368E4205